MEEGTILGSCCPETDSVLLRKQFLCPARTSENHEIQWSCTPVFCLTFISFALSDLSNIRWSKKLIFTCCSVLTDFCHILPLAFLPFLSSSNETRSLGKKYLQYLCFMDEFYLCRNWTQVILYLDLLMLLIKNFVKFCMKEVFKCRERRMMRWDEEWTKAQAWGCPCHPKTYSRSTSVKAWGFPRHPLLHQ